MVLRQEHRAGEKMFVDYAGDTIPIHDPQTGEVHFRPPSSWPCWAPAAIPSPKPPAGRICGAGSVRIIRALEFFGGVTEVVVPDNLKTAVTHPSRYEPDLNPTYRDLGEHYGVAIIPARPYQTTDKAKARWGFK